MTLPTQILTFKHGSSDGKWFKPRKFQHLFIHSDSKVFHVESEIKKMPFLHEQLDSARK